MSELKPLICPRCGGKVNRGTYTCEFCGTAFEKPENEGIRVELVERKMPVKCYAIECRMSMYELKYYAQDGLVESRIRERFANEIAKKIANEICIKQDFSGDPLSGEAKFNGKLYIGQVNSI